MKMKKDNNDDNEKQMKSFSVISNAFEKGFLDPTIIIVGQSEL